MVAVPTSVWMGECEKYWIVDLIAATVHKHKPICLVHDVLRAGPERFAHDILYVNVLYFKEIAVVSHWAFLPILLFLFLSLLYLRFYSFLALHTDLKCVVVCWQTAMIPSSGLKQTGGWGYKACHLTFSCLTLQASLLARPLGILPVLPIASRGLAQFKGTVRTVSFGCQCQHPLRTDAQRKVGKGKGTG